MRVDHSVNTLSHTCSPPYISAHAAYTELYTLSLHDALPISSFLVVFNRPINILCRVSLFLSMALCLLLRLNKETRHRMRSEERFSRNAETDLVCRLLLEKKKRKWRESR